MIVAEAATVAPPAPTRAEALAYWFRLGCLSFGGPAGQIALMHRELVDEKRWISERRFLHALNYCMVLPGPEAQQLATYIGWLMHRTWGGIVAGGLFVLPSLVLLIALSWLYMAYGNVPAVAGVLYGVKPAVVAIVLQAAWRMRSRSLRHPVLWVIAALALIAIALLSAPFPAIVFSAGLAGYVGGRVVPAAFATDARHHGCIVRPEFVARLGVRRRHVPGRMRANGQERVAELSQRPMEQIDVRRESPWAPADNREHQRQAVACRPHHGLRRSADADPHAQPA